MRSRNPPLRGRAACVRTGAPVPVGLGRKASVSTALQGMIVRDSGGGEGVQMHSTVMLRAESPKVAEMRGREAGEPVLEGSALVTDKPMQTCLGTRYEGHHGWDTAGAMGYRNFL